MTNRERVIATLNHRQPDKIPYNIGFTQKAHAKMANFYNDPEFVSKLGNCLITLGCEPESAWKEIKPDIWRDQFGVEWDRTIDKDIGVVRNCLINDENIDEYEFPNPDDPSRYRNYKPLISSNKDGFIVSNLGFSLFERAWTLTGMENLLIAMGTDPDFIHDLLERILQYNLKIIQNACSFDIDAMMFGDDWGHQYGLIMGAEMWREFIKPRIKEMYQLVKSKGKFVFIHSCGKVDEIFPDLIECGLDMFNPFQPEVMDVFEIKMRYGDRLCFYGGISTQQTLPYGSIQQVKQEVRKLLEKVGKDGGYIASPAHAIPSDAKVENIDAMIKTLQNQ
ncbi:uroporphyrinogen decarboxylase [Candidatus Poribacteria bacterium]|nr:uroporphyrinogen decarboxylase [Candidatus Poribacteria bacterium]